MYKAVRLVTWFHNLFLRFPFRNLSYAVLPNISLGLGDPQALPGLSKRISVIVNLRLSLERCPISSSSWISGSLIPAHLLQIPLQGLGRKFEKWWDFCPPLRYAPAGEGVDCMIVTVNKHLWGSGFSSVT